MDNLDLTVKLNIRNHFRRVILLYGAIHHYYLTRKYLCIQIEIKGQIVILNKRIFLNKKKKGIDWLVPRGCLRFVIVVLSDHTHLLFLLNFSSAKGTILLFNISCLTQHTLFK